MKIDRWGNELFEEPFIGINEEMIRNGFDVDNWEGDGEGSNYSKKKGWIYTDVSITHRKDIRKGWIFVIDVWKYYEDDEDDYEYHEYWYDVIRVKTRKEVYDIIQRKLA